MIQEYYPDTITNLPHAIVGVPYSTVIQVKVLTDTNTFYQGLPIHACFDSIVITNVSGLPPNYTFSCTPPSCGFPGGGDGCILLSGPAPTSGQLGMIYPIMVFANRIRIHLFDKFPYFTGRYNFWI
jgi:hypothetical protein